MNKAINLKNYFRIPSDNRDLNYEKYFSKGEKSIDNIDEYNSHNTKRLNLEETKNILLKIDYIRDDLGL